MRWLVLLILSATLARAEDERAGRFDYYVLSLSWSPGWCASEGARRDAPQCAPGRGLGWMLHGLWPQYEEGWPSFCRTPRRDPSRADTRAMTDIMGSAGLAWHQWKKHGRCSGLTADAYFDAARRAYEAVTRPEVFRKLPKTVRLPARVVEDAFLAANPGWAADMLTITCKNGRIQEARLCLTRDLVPRRCGEDIDDDCRLNGALMPPVD
ncbi:ribonuclease T2 [Rhodovulum iodosum]|uniref:Ribonuclease T2 n=1 Tax=Rhodovulum iodosum TaxID=68291 RepID=A0ABV3XRC6_9RHOB|nr:ribonuclease T2 [Rhodovulum robiginosum]RSK32831.1 ribonuclease T [Rhodovulum robiginosum]